MSEAIYSQFEIYGFCILMLAMPGPGFLNNFAAVDKNVGFSKDPSPIHCFTWNMYLLPVFVLGRKKHSKYSTCMFDCESKLL